MDYQKNFMQKHGIVIENIATQLLTLKVGDRIPTIISLSEDLSVGRGTVQTALNNLKELGAINTVSKGHQGTILTDMDFNKLLQVSGETNFAGVMPLPHSKRYEGLATGLYEVLNTANFKVSLAFMTGSRSRLNALQNDRYDFIVISKSTAEKYIVENDNIEMVCELHEGSFVTKHVLIVNRHFNDQKEKMKVGIDLSSSDQCDVTMNYFHGQDVQLVPIKYSNIIESIKNNIIDGAIWSEGNIELQSDVVKVSDIVEDTEDKKKTRATVVVKKDNERVKAYLNRYMDVNRIKNIQSKIVQGKMLPNF